MTKADGPPPARPPYEFRAAKPFACTNSVKPVPPCTKPGGWFPALATVAPLLRL